MPGVTELVMPTIYAQLRADYGQSNPDSSFGPIEDGGVCNTVWERNSQSFYTMESFNTTHACTRRWNSDCSADMGGTACHELGQCDSEAFMVCKRFEGCSYFDHDFDIRKWDSPHVPKTCPFWLWKSRRQTDTFRLRELSDDHFSINLPFWRSMATNPVFYNSPGRFWSHRTLTDVT